MRLGNGPVNCWLPHIFFATNRDVFYINHHKSHHFMILINILCWCLNHIFWLLIFVFSGRWWPLGHFWEVGTLWGFGRSKTASGVTDVVVGDPGGESRGPKIHAMVAHRKRWCPRWSVRSVGATRTPISLWVFVGDISIIIYNIYMYL